MIAYILLLVVLIAGYPVYLNIRDKQLAKRIEKLGKDPSRILAELDVEIQKTRAEGEFFRKQSGKGPWL